MALTMQILQDPGTNTGLLAGRGKYAHLIAGIQSRIYNAFRGTKLAASSKSASGELMAVLWWLSSGLCSTIDVYGMAFPQNGATHSRAYWATASYDRVPMPSWPGPSVPKSNAVLEMYALHAAMRAGYLCVHAH